MGENLKDLIYEIKDELKIFHLLNNEDLDQIIPFFEIVDCPKGNTLFIEGDPGDFVGFITSGKLEVKKQTEFKGRQIILALLSKGSLVGELSMVDEQPRSATVSAVVDSQLVVLRRKALDSIMQTYPYIGIKILKGLNEILSTRLRKAVDRLSVIF
jgi:CRP-like cAMP-binding protein